MFLFDSYVKIYSVTDMVKYSLLFLVLLVTTTYAQIGEYGTGTVNGYYIGPYADLSGADLTNADLTNADLTGANLSNTDLSSADLTGVTSGNITGTPTLPSGYQMISGYIVGPGVDLSGADLTGVDLTGVDLEGADLSGADLTGADLRNALFGGTIWSNVISQSDYDAVVAERDVALAAQASAEAERDAKLTLDEVKDLRAGSTMIEIDNGQATLSMEVEESDELGSWTISGNVSTNILLKAGEDKKFFRFKMNNSDFDLNDLTLSVGDTEYDETAIKAALAEQYEVPVESISLSVNPG